MRTAIIENHKLTKQQKFIFSEFWMLEIKVLARSFF